jgi:hypothetical protein
VIGFLLRGPLPFLVALGIVGRVSARSQSCPPTTMTGWPSPNRSKAMVVSSLEVNVSMSTSSQRAPHGNVNVSLGAYPVRLTRIVPACFVNRIFLS